MTQRLVVTRAQLLELGVTQRQIERALERGQLFRLHRGVYALVPPGALPPLAREQAALLAAGPGAALSHHTAARLHGLRLSRPRTSAVELTVPGHRAIAGVELHRVAAPLPARDRHRVRRLLATSAARTVCDLEPALGDRALEHLLDQALRTTSRARLLEAGDRLDHPRIVALLDPARPSSDTWSEAEEHLLTLLRDTDLPPPETNVELLGYRPDLLWREQRVIVEYDSVAFHSGPGVFHADRERHNALTAAGYTVLHVTWRDLTDHPHRVLVWIAQALTRAELHGRAASGPSPAPAPSPHHGRPA